MKVFCIFNLIRGVILLSLLLASDLLYSQDTSVTWLNNIDTLNFKIQYDKNKIPKRFYNAIGISRKKEIASAKDAWSPSCTAEQRCRLNWIANDKNDHWVMSVTYGGRMVSTNYYFFDKENGELNINELDFNRYLLMFTEIPSLIKSREFKFKLQGE